MMTRKRLTLRLPQELHQVLLERARSNRRSLNGEIEFLLWQALQLNVDAYARARGTLRAPRSRPATPGA